MSAAHGEWQVRNLKGFIAQAGPLWTRREGDAWAYGFAVEPHHLNPAGIAHGGSLLTLVDHAISTVAWEACERTPCITLQLDSHFVGAVLPGQFIEARARVLRRAGALLFMRGEVSAEGHLVLSAQALMKAQKT